jgi:hypothetical protein
MIIGVPWFAFFVENPNVHFCCVQIHTAIKVVSLVGKFELQAISKKSLGLLPLMGLGVDFEPISLL